VKVKVNQLPIKSTFNADTDEPNRCPGFLPDGLGGVGMGLGPGGAPLKQVKILDVILI